MDKSIRFRVDGDRVLMILNGVLLAEWGYSKAQEVAKALHSVSKTAEANSSTVRDQIIQDQALMMRSGFMPGLSLTNDKKVFEQAKQEAQFSKKLRKYLKRTPVVPSGLRWGLPRLVQCNPQEGEHGGL